MALPPTAFCAALARLTRDRQKYGSGPQWHFPSPIAAPLVMQRLKHITSHHIASSPPPAPPSLTQSPTRHSCAAGNRGRQQLCAAQMDLAAPAARHACSRQHAAPTALSKQPPPAARLLAHSTCPVARAWLMHASSASRPHQHAAQSQTRQPAGYPADAGQPSLAQHCHSGCCIPPAAATSVLCPAAATQHCCQLSAANVTDGCCIYLQH